MPRGSVVVSIGGGNEVKALVESLGLRWMRWEKGGERIEEVVRSVLDELI